MKKLIALAALVFLVSGCGGGNSNKFAGNTNPTSQVKQVAVLSSPAFQIGSDYEIYKGARLSGMNGSQYYVADTGSSSNQATLNLGLLDELGAGDTLAFVKDGQVVFAYDPSGASSSATTGGTVTMSGGTRLSYNGLTIASAAFFTALDVDTSSAKTIVLNGNTATFEGEAVTVYPYVWHADPNHRDEYWTDGIDGIIEYDEDAVSELMSGDVYIARDIRYMTSSLDFTGTAEKDGETEYVAYYSDAVRAIVSAELGAGFEGPYIFATLPMTGGGMGPGGGGNPGSGDRPGGDNPMSGDRPTPPNVRATSYNEQIASTMSLMTHSAEDAYNNPVLHINKAGVYRLQGTWNGQIWIDAGDDSGDCAVVILDGVTVSCSVAPAIVFHDLYECGPDDEDEVVSLDVGKDLMSNAGAMVVIADGTTNTFTGSNVYRILKPEAKKSATKIDGTDISDQKKRYKMDGAFYSFVSLAIGGGEKADGVLNIKSNSFEGLDAELHMLVESGKITVYAPDDAINVNEDDVSVFTMLGGSLTITSEGGDGIDSNGYVVVLGGSLDITAGSQKIFSAGEAGIDAEKGVYVDEANATYNWTAISGNGGGGSIPGSGDVPGQPGSGDVPPVTSPDQPVNPTPQAEVIQQDTNYTAPMDATVSSQFTTTRGTTTFNMGTGSTTSFVAPDPDAGTPRGISSSGNTFRLNRKVNTFSGIR